MIPIDELLNSNHVEIVSPPKNWQRTLPEFVIDLSDENLSHHLWREGERPVGGTYEAKFEKCRFFFGQAFVGIFDEKDRYIGQEIFNQDVRLRYHTRNPPESRHVIPRISRVEDDFFVDFPASPPKAQNIFVKEVFYCSPWEPLNWGMWVLQTVPAILRFIESGNDADVLCWMPYPWQRKFLHYLGVPDAQIIHVEPWETYMCTELRIPLYGHVDLFVREADKVQFELLQRRERMNTQKMPEKIFVSRRTLTSKSTNSYRGLQNEDELIAALSELGFQTIEPEAFTFGEQVSAFSAAKIIVGLGGAGMFNTAFSNPGSLVVTIEANNAFVHGHANLFASLGHRYGVIFGKKDSSDDRFPHHRWTVDTKKVIAELKQYI